ncbi:MAG: response regulator [Actinomycetota bacterium]
MGDMQTGMRGERPSVLLADDHSVLRNGFRSILESEGFWISAEATDRDSAVVSATVAHPDLCLIDVSVPGGGVAAAAEIHERVPETIVIMITSEPSDDELFDSLRAGVQGYLPTTVDPVTLPRVLRAALDGEAVVPRQLVSHLIHEFAQLPRRRPVEKVPSLAALTARQWQILDLLDEGVSTTDIGRMLSISPITVRRHIERIVKKLRVHDRDSALRLLKQA